MILVLWLIIGQDNKKHMNKFFSFKFIIFSIFLSLFFSHNAYAATLSVNLDKLTVKTGEVFTANLLLDTGGQSINTIEGDLKYDAKVLQAEVINIGNSFISLWIEKPNKETLGKIHFSGVVPGGISVKQGEIFRVIFRAKTIGNTNLLFANANLFINDGLGTKAETKIENKSIKITKGSIVINSVIISEDKTAPEKFSIVRTRDPSIFNNQWFIVFSTEDKDSGVDHYQVCELFKCASAESPFLLKNQTPFYYIVVKAYDMNGNFTSSTLVSSWLILLSVLLFAVILYICFYLRKNLARK